MNRENYTKEECWKIADALAAERLPEINQKSESVQVNNTFYSKYIKRIMDILISGIALVVTSPINLFVLIGTFLDVGRPIIFKQERVGKKGKPFTIIKFRNMTNDTDENGELLPASLRVTKFGGFVRKSSLDELLNFWSIFKGDMSLIGPRPLLPEYTKRYSDRHKSRLEVRPGLECPPPIDYLGEWTWNAQFENDIWYVEHVSFVTDVKMIIRLVHFALSPHSSSSRGEARRTAFLGYNSQGKAISLSEVPDEYASKVLSSLNKTKSDNLN